MLPREALLGSAEQLWAVEERSALAVGVGAELINSGTDRVECPADGLIDNPVLMMLVDGEIVVRAI